MEEHSRKPDRRRTRLPGSVVATDPSRLGSPRESGLQRLRRLSNWSLAALVVGVGATTAALARTIPATTSSTVAVATPRSTTTSSTTGNQSSPKVTSPVATLSASGVSASTAGASSVGTSSSSAGRATFAVSRDS